jgi:hypothetical protein
LQLFAVFGPPPADFFPAQNDSKENFFDRLSRPYLGGDDFVFPDPHVSTNNIHPI